MEIKKIVPVIGNISTGKSSFLNYLIGRDLLQTGGSLKTRTIIIIRNSEIDNPVFSHIKRFQVKGKWKYIKDEYDPKTGKIVQYIGDVEIKRKIESLNDTLALSQGIEDVHEYSNQMYMLEVKIKNIDNKDFLKKYDLADIPGLNSIKSKKNTDGDIKEIFLPLQGLIEFGFLLFDATQYLDQLAIEILKVITDSKRNLILADEVKENGNFKMKNFLIILNKIDRIDESKREDTLEDFKAYLLNKLGNDILSDDNSIITMNCKYLKEEETSLSSFETYLLFTLGRFINSGLSITPIDYLKNEISYSYYITHKSQKRKTYSAIAQSLTNEEDETLSEELKIKIDECISYLNQNYGKNIKIDLDDEDDENVMENVKLFNLINKLIKSPKPFFFPHLNSYKASLTNYFNKFDPSKPKNKIGNSNETMDRMKEDTSCINKNYFKALENIREFYEMNIKNKIDKNLQYLFNEDISTLEESMKNLDKIRIAVWGTYNSGKSSTINNIIGKDLLQVKNEQCTAKPILIRYANSDIPKIYKAKFDVKKDNYCKKHYYFSSTGLPLAKGDDAVRDFINSQNHLVVTGSTVEDPQEFYILETRIKLLDDLNIPGSKETVEFIDLPGGNATIPKDGAFESMIHRTVIFLIIIDPTIGGLETESFNKEMNFLRNTIFMADSKGDDFTAPYLFVCNKYDLNKDFDPNKCQKNLNDIFEVKNKIFPIVRYSAKHGKILREKSIIYSPEFYIRNSYQEFILTLYNKKHSFMEFLIKKIKKEIEVEFYKKYEKGQDNIALINQIKYILYSNDYLSEKSENGGADIELINQFSAYLSFAQKNIITLNTVNLEVNYEFKNAIAKKIEYGLYFLRDGYKNNIERVIQNFNCFFQLGVISENKGKINDEYKRKNLKLLEDLKKIFRIYNLPFFIDVYHKNVYNFMRNEDRINFNKYEDELKKKNMKLVEMNNNFGKEFQTMCENFSRELKEKVNEVDKITSQYFSLSSNLDADSTAGEVLKSIGYGSLGAVLGTAGCVILAPFVIAGGLIVATDGGAAVIGGIALLCVAVEYGIGALLIGTGIGAGIAAVGGLLIWAAKNAFESMSDTFSERKRKKYREGIEKIIAEFDSHFNPLERKIKEEFQQHLDLCNNYLIKINGIVEAKIEMSNEEKKEIFKRFEEKVKYINNLLN